MEHITRLTDLPYNTPAKIHSLTASGLSKLDLMLLGIIPGTLITVIRQAPFGGPLQIYIIGAHIALLEKAAKTIYVEIADDLINSR